MDIPENNKEVRLSPPWYTFANQIKYTYGASKFIHVNDLIEVDGEYLLTINVYDNRIARALRQILPMEKMFGNVDVDIAIFDCNGHEVPISNQEYTPEALGELFCIALKCNPLFVGVVLTGGKIPAPIINSVGNVVVIIDKCVVQFYNDDIADLCSNYNEVAAKVFLEVSTLKYPSDLTVGFNTYDENCQLQKQRFC